MSGAQGERKRERDAAGRPKLAESDPRLDPESLHRERRRLDKAWADGRGLIAWISTIDHKAIGRRYIVTAFVFLVLFIVSLISGGRSRRGV